MAKTLNAHFRARLADIRRAVAEYVHSEGCGCCEGGDHDQHAAELAKLLRVPKYKDGSGYNFGKYRGTTKRVRHKRTTDGKA